MLKYSVVLVALTLSACSSAPTINGFQKDETLSTLNDKSQPDWADESKPFVVKDGKVLSVGITTLSGSDRPEAGMRISENNARANIAKSISNRMEFLFQNAEENAGMDSTQTHFVGSEASNLTSHSMTVEGHWYKRYAQSNEDGSRKILYKIYSLVTIPEIEMKKAIDQAINGLTQEKKISASFQDKVNKQWDRFIDGPATESRKPASVASNESK